MNYIIVRFVCQKYNSNQLLSEELHTLKSQTVVFGGGGGRKIISVVIHPATDPWKLCCLNVFTAIVFPLISPWAVRNRKQEGETEPHGFQDDHTQPGWPVEQELTSRVPPSILGKKKILKKNSPKTKQPFWSLWKQYRPADNESGKTLTPSEMG